MSEHEHDGITEEAGADLEYDLAHEVSDAPPPASNDKPKPPTPVATATPEYDGDYSYDLAHDIPRN